nr:YrhC family protein [Peribacillus deserti]
MVDYKRFAFSLICASVFFYLGVLISSHGKGLNPDYLMMGATILFISLSGVFFYLSAKYKSLLSQSEKTDV